MAHVFAFLFGEFVFVVRRVSIVGFFRLRNLSLVNEVDMPVRIVENGAKRRLIDMDAVPVLCHGCCWRWKSGIGLLSSCFGTVDPFVEQSTHVTFGCIFQSLSIFDEGPDTLFQHCLGRSEMFECELRLGFQLVLELRPLTVRVVRAALDYPAPKIMALFFEFGIQNGKSILAHVCSRKRLLLVVTEVAMTVSTMACCVCEI